MYGGFGYRDKSGAQGRLNSLVTVKPVENIEQKKDELEDRFKVEDVVVEGEEPPGWAAWYDIYMWKYCS